MDAPRGRAVVRRHFGTSGWAGVHYETDLWFHANLADPTAQGQV